MLARPTHSPALLASPCAAPRTRRDTRCTAVRAALLIAVLAAPATAFADEPAAPDAPAPPAAKAAPVPALPPPAPIAPPSPPPYGYGDAYTYPPGGLVPPCAPGWNCPHPVDPVAAAYLAEADEEALEKLRKQRKARLPESVTGSPEYKAARGKRIGGILALSLGGGSVFVGAIVLAWASLRNWSFTHPAEPDRAGQAGGGILMGLGVTSMLVGIPTLVIGRREIREIEDDYFRSVPPPFTIGVGAGSVSLSMAF